MHDKQKKKLIANIPTLLLFGILIALLQSYEISTWMAIIFGVLAALIGQFIAKEIYGRL